MQKILMVVEALGGGVFTYVTELANNMCDDFEIHVAYAVRPQTPPNFKNYFDSRVHLIEVENFTREIRLKSDLQAFFEIRKIEKNIQPDIIHLHSSKAGILGRLAFSGYKRPMYYTPHGYSFLMKNYCGLKRGMLRVIESICSKRNCMTISCSKGEHLETLKMTKNANYINNGIDLVELDKVISKVKIDKEAPFTVYTIGRICFQKNPDLFNKVAQKLPNIRFLWIGDGELRDKLTAPNIEITGWVDRNEVLVRSMSANIFMLTSLWEGLPISMLESMYMKKLCVVSNVIGNNNVIHNDQNGFVCSNSEEFVNAIIKGREDNEKLINRAYEDVLKEYNTKVMVKKYKQLYISELNKRNSEQQVVINNGNTI